jgi:hypothetical protein
MWPEEWNLIFQYLDTGFDLLISAFEPIGRVYHGA